MPFIAGTTVQNGTNHTELFVPLGNGQAQVYSSEQQISQNSITGIVDTFTTDSDSIGAGIFRNAGPSRPFLLVQISLKNP